MELDGYKIVWISIFHKPDYALILFHTISWAQVALDDISKTSSQRARTILEQKVGGLKREVEDDLNKKMRGQ